MTRWERFKRWLVRFLVPDWDREVLLSRLKTVHERMREMYWEEQAKVAAAARIARLEESLVEACTLAAERGGPAADAAAMILENKGLRDRVTLALQDVPSKGMPRAGWICGHCDGIVLLGERCDCPGARRERMKGGAA